MTPMSSCAWLASAACFFGFAWALAPPPPGQDSATSRTATSHALLRQESLEQAAQEVNNGAPLEGLNEQVVQRHSMQLENHAKRDVAEEAATKVSTCSSSWSMACAQEYLQSSDMRIVLAKVHDFDCLAVFLHPAAKAAIALADWRQSEHVQQAPTDDKSSEAEPLAILAEAPPKKQKQQTSIAAAVTTTIFALLFAYLYQQNVTFKRKRPVPAPTDDGFNKKFSLAETEFTFCHNGFDLQYCLHSCCCMPSRLGDTHQQLEVAGCLPCLGPFWSVVLWWLFITNFVAFAKTFLPMPFGGAGQGLVHLLLDLMFAWYLASQRHVLREKLGYTGNSNMCCDILLYLCCLPCITFQDAMQVDGATGTSVWCCCNIKVLSGADDTALYEGKLIGDPVEATAADAPQAAGTEAAAATPAGTEPAANETPPPS